MRSHPLRALLFFALLFASLTLPARAGADAGSFDGAPDQVVLRPELGPALAAGAGYLSPPTRAAGPFTHLLLRRDAHVPDGAGLTIALRVSADGQAWSEWRELGENDDLWVEADGHDVWWSEIVDTGAPARFWQVRGEFASSPDGQQPQVRQIDVNTVDTRLSTEQEAQATAAGTQLAAAPGRPAVVSRTGWGNPDGQGSRAAPDYYPVNHLVVHHTADSSSLLPGEPNWAARMRALWSFHTNTRRWGDIGYNYLIDPNGVIYEGRAGGDDAVGFHDTANYGSMGVSVIGTYTSDAPTEASQDSLVRLLAWKAGQKRIDPLGSSYYYGCARSSFCAPKLGTAVVPNIAGHRQVTPGHTSCPGDTFMALLPGIRNRVKQLLANGPTDNGDLQIDELESGFSRSAAQWHAAPCGAGSNTFYTYTTDNPAESTNRGRWQPNIPASGAYRVYVSIPQNCGLAGSPRASAKARYRISHAGGVAERLVDQNVASAWVDLGVYSFAAGGSGAVELDDLTGEPYAERRVLFFDAIKWVPERADSTRVELVDVRFDRASVTSGELLQVTFTVKNTGETTLYSQAPQISPGEDAYVYDEGECFLGNSAGSYPSFPKESNRFRVTLGPIDGSSQNCAGNVGGYPWRWGLNGDLAPGATREITGFVRFYNDGTSSRVVTLQAGLVQEYVKYYAQQVKPTQIVVAPERATPDAPAFDSVANPQARVYTLGAVPVSLLARTSSALSVPRGEYVGSFGWNGAYVDWVNGGPLGLSDRFVVEQTRSFVAPADGTYTFRTTSDDGSWLWVDGQQVVLNAGLHPAKELQGQVTLTAGTHVVAFKYFERSGQASAGYDVRLPGASEFSLLPEANTAGRVGNIFFQTPSLAIAGDDQGGIGVDHIRWSWDGATWEVTPGPLLQTGLLQNGAYHLRYQAIDRLGNQGDQRDLIFTVNTGLRVTRTFLPLAAK